MQISKDYRKKTRDPHLHSPAHVLADELSRDLGDPRNFALYLKMALTVNKNVLQKIKGLVLEKPTSHPGALFSYLVKKHHNERASSDGYALWLIPSPVDLPPLKKTISKLAELFNSKDFPAHISLLDNLQDEDLTKFETLLPPVQFQLQLPKVLHEEIYFKSLYYEVLKSKDLAKLRRLTRKHFNVDKPDPYRPHLPILYGNFIPEDKEKIITKFSPKAKTITIAEICLAKVEGTVDEWKIIKTIKLNPIN